MGGEDFVNVGQVALLQDEAAQATLTEVPGQAVIRRTWCAVPGAGGLRARPLQASATSERSSESSTGLYRILSTPRRR